MMLNQTTYDVCATLVAVKGSELMLRRHTVPTTFADAPISKLFQGTGLDFTIVRCHGLFFFGGGS